MNSVDVIIFSIVIFGVIWAIFLRTIPETFGSDWNSAFWGPMIWTGWNYGTPYPRTPPKPERTKVYSAR